MQKSRKLFIISGLLWSCVLLCASNVWAQIPKSSVARREMRAQRMRAKIDLAHLPEHVAIIMDGNGRWATKCGKSRVFGHQNAIQSVKEVVAGCGELGIPYLTLYTFSKENWKRPQVEVDSLMDLIVTTINAQLTELVQNNVRLNFIGDLLSLPLKCQQAIQRATQASCHNQGLLLTIALSYSGEWDMAEAAKAITQDVQAGKVKLQDIDAKLFKSYLSTKDMPAPALLIRTSGEMRLSNFLLGQLAYTELFFTSILWPDFRKCHLYDAILSYQKRERRFGSLCT